MILLSKEIRISKFLYLNQIYIDHDYVCSIPQLKFYPPAWPTPQHFGDFVKLGQFHKSSTPSSESGAGVKLREVCERDLTNIHYLEYARDQCKV